MSYAGSSLPQLSLEALFSAPFLFRTGFFAVCVLLLALVELPLARRAAPAGRFRTRALHLGLFAVNTLGLAVAGPLLLSLLAPLILRIGVSHAPFSAMPAGPRLLLSFVALDLALFAYHRAAHGVPLLWRFHRAHHTDEALDVTTSLRFHLGDLLCGLVVVTTVASVLSIDEETLVRFQLVSALVSQLVHSNVRLPRAVERALAIAFVTPGTHAVHHAASSDSRSNYGAMLALWDHVFGTFRDASPPQAFGSGLVDGARPDLLELLAMPLELPPEERPSLGLAT